MAFRALGPNLLAEAEPLEEADLDRRQQDDAGEGKEHPEQQREHA
jgi:hypothetical protein